MSVLTIRMPDDKHDRLKALAKSRNMSVNKLIEELSTIAISEFDARSRFLARSSKGDPEQALELLDKLDSQEHTEK